MDVRVASHQVDTSEAVRELRSSGSPESPGKCLPGRWSNLTSGAAPTMGSAATLSRHLQGRVLKASHSAREPQMAFNGAANRIEKQLRRYMSRLKAHKSGQSQAEYVENAAYTIFTAPEGEVKKKAGFPAIVRKSKVDIPEASVSDAVMMMDLRNTNATVQE